MFIIRSVHPVCKVRPYPARATGLARAPPILECAMLTIAQRPAERQRGGASRHSQPTQRQAMGLGPWPSLQRTGAWVWGVEYNIFIASNLSCDMIANNGGTFLEYFLLKKYFNKLSFLSVIHSIDRVLLPLELRPNTQQQAEERILNNQPHGFRLNNPFDLFKNLNIRFQ